MKKVKSKMRAVLLNRRGFNVTELVITLACISFLVSVAASFSGYAYRSDSKINSKLNAVEQRGEIRDLLFKGVRSGTWASCSSLIGGNPFSAYHDYEIPIQNLGISLGDKHVNLDRLYLTELKQIGSQGTDVVYSGQLVAIQSVTTGGVTETLNPSILGLMTITVDSSNHISACDWDESTLSPMQVCGSTSGLTASSNGSSCISEGSLPIIGACPGGTTMDLVASHCVPSNVDCFAKALGQRFDGSSFGCSFIPVNYAIIYPSGFQAPASSINPDQAPTTSTSQQSAQPTPPQGCTCGQQMIAPGDTSSKCVRVQFVDNEGFGNYDDYFEAQVCNSQGVLEPASPRGYKNEYGSGQHWGPRIATCRANDSGTFYYNSYAFVGGVCY